ncbi:Uncharacterized protein YjaZ [Pseudonocardia ammonioxydans]|uniref:Uncharacterized protein YjaZ n=1 Tax=Pseudonocardia ammonioxydans TaxID=260086 RepID=A0A1I4X7X7_PSUAM|nr:DUF2268 domain-containing putative Zn-dependent protease [Pseudonocardia ammonioxydans]SFN22081.1 Uncharacterized protein YjaZ [Pseudonocardia ammonioxydans]
MTVTVLDTAPAMERILQAPAAEREPLLRAMLEPAAGLYRYFPGEPDLVALHRMGGGFPIDRDIEACAEGLRLLREADAWNRVDTAVREGAAVLEAANPGVTAPDVVVLLVLGDPGDDFFHTTNLGLTANGSVTGYLHLCLWRDPENLDRLEATAVHELHHNVRYAPGNVVWDPAAVTVGEHVVSEGLADAFARERYGDELGLARIGVAPRHDDAAFARVLEGLEVTGMAQFAAWVHGDAHAARFGAEPVGLPTGAGYAAGNRLVDAYLAATGRSAAQALLTDSREVIDTALRRLQVSR